MRLRSILPSLMVVLMFFVSGIAILILIETVQITNNPPTQPSIENGQTQAEPLSIQTKIENSEREQSVSRAFNLSPLISRPLVSQSRRMPIVKIEEVLEPPVEEVKIEPVAIVELPSPPHIQMLGSFTDNDDEAALVVLESGEEIWVRIGAKIDNWTVHSITPQTLTLQLNGESVDINAIE